MIGRVGTLAVVPSRTHVLGGRRWQIFLANPATKVALLILVISVAGAVFPVEWLPHDPTVVLPGERHIPPIWKAGGSVSHPLGTDHLGRDIFSRLIFSTRYTLGIMLGAVLMSTLAGLGAGFLAGFHGGFVDMLVSRLVDVQLAVPVILLAIVLLAILGSSLVNLVLILALLDWGSFTRLARGLVLSIKETDYVEAARALGCTNSRIIMRHVLPNAVSPILVLVTLAMARVLLAESGVSFLGLGIAPPRSTWGGMLGEGRDYLTLAWWSSAFPGLVIALTVLATNFLGDGLRDALDPQTTSLAKIG